MNIALIMGLSAAYRAIHFGRRTLLLDLPSMALAAVLVLFFTLDGELQFWEGIPLTAAAVAYTLALGWWTRRDKDGARDALAAVIGEEEPTPEPKGSAWGWYALVLIAGIVVIVLGADWLVSGSVALAKEFGVSDAFIGLTVVAIGTSAPELFTTVVATVRGDRDIAVGNLIGSSIYNLTLILGVPVLVAHGSGPIDSFLLHIDVPIMAAVSLLCIVLFLTGRRLSRGEGVFLVVGYVTYLTYLIVARS